jgi:hypothetical protein
MTSIKWTNKQLVEALQSVPDEPAKATLWWKSTAGIALLTQITDHVAMPVVRGVQRELSVEVDPAEVASTAWLMLSPDRPVLLRHLTQDATGNAWAYLFTSIKNQILDDVGRYYRRELLDDRSYTPTEEVFQRESTLDYVVDATVGVLIGYTPPVLRDRLLPAVDWLADAASQGRLSYLHTRAGSSPEMESFGFGGDRGRALANVTVGTRPEHSRNSLFAGFLLHPQWDPRFSPRHASAIREYANRIAAASVTVSKGI